MSIYVLRSDNLVKIGFSDNLRNRVQAIVATVPVPVEFVGHMPGGRDLEAHLHEIFDASHFSGEWFVETEAMRSLFDMVLIPLMPIPETQEEIKRTAEKTDTQKISQQVKDAAVERWPTKSKSEVINALAIDLGWSRTRAKDFFYADPRIALRAYELQEVDKWLCDPAPPGG
ncbi:GIY-YIG nuclease family protein [Rhizobium herbae]